MRSSMLLGSEDTRSLSDPQFGQVNGILAIPTQFTPEGGWATSKWRV